MENWPGELALTLDGPGRIAPQSAVTAKRELAPYMEELVSPLTKQEGELASMVWNRQTLLPEVPVETRPDHLIYHTGVYPGL